MASIWKGSLTFGLVSVPVELKTAVRADHISFRMLHAEDLSPIKYERVCAADGEPVPWGEIVKGYEYEKGKFVVMTDDDFKAAALEGSKSLDILDFVRADEIDWISADGNYARLHVGARVHLVRETMAALEAALDPARFVRIHRSAIVNVDRIASLEPYFHGEYVVTMRDGSRLTSSRSYSARLRALLG